MARFGEFWRRLQFLLRRKQLDSELQEEMLDHLQRKAEKNMATGMPAGEAYQSARRELGNVLRQREESRSSWGFPWLESIVQDVRYGWRSLRNSPGFTVVAVLTLAVGIGATTAIFSITNAVVLRQLRYRDAGRLVQVWGGSQRFPGFRMGLSYPDVVDLKAQTSAFETVAWWQAHSLVLTGGSEPEQISAIAVSLDFFRLFSIQPQLGTLFQPGDDEMKNGHVVLLSYSLWQRRFAGDAGIVGRTVRFDDAPYTVAGVLPKDFSVVHEEAWVPLIVAPEDKIKRQNWMYLTLAKLKPGQSVREAQAEMNQFQAQLARAYPKDESDGHLEVMLMRDAAVNDDNRTQLLTLLGAVSFLLLIGCANVSNLLLSRSVQRQREIAVRAALGASRSRLLRQLLVESLVLALVGGAAGILLSEGGIHAFRAFAPTTFSRVDELRMEPGVALIALLLSCLAGMLCGLIPALQTSKSDLMLAFKDRAGTVSTRLVSQRSLLVILEVSLALVLLAGSALMAQSLVRMIRVDPGFRTERLLTGDIELSAARYPSEASRRLFIQRLLEGLRAEPQFRQIALADNALLSRVFASFSFDPEFMGIHQSRTNLEAKSVSPGFFEAMGIPMLAGRSFNDRDTNGSPAVVIVSQLVAQRFLPGQDPVGKIFKIGPDRKERFEIVGLVADIRDIELKESPRPQIYFPLLQVPYNGMSVMVRGTGDPLALTKLLQQRVATVDKDQPVTHVASMGEVIAKSVAEPRFRTWLLGAFAIAGLTLTLVGIYGVISYSVNQRAREIGIRVALGAQRRDVLGLVLKQGLGLAMLGAACGVVASLGLTRLLASQLYGIKPGDPLTLVGAALLMIVVAACATYIPARRATTVDPMIALRNE